MCKYTKNIKRIIAALLTVTLVMSGDYSGFFAVHAQENQEEIELSTDVSDGDVVLNEASIQLEGYLDEYGSAIIAWSFENVAEDIIGDISVYRDEALCANLGADAKEFCDVTVLEATRYTYYVEIHDISGEVLAKSNAVEIEVPAALNITGNYTLSQNTTVYSLNISSGTLDLNGYSLTVLKDVKQSGGTLNFNKGVLACYGNFNVSGYSYVYMTNANDYLYVDKNITWENYSTSYNDLTNGTIEVCGNFTQATRTSFQPSSYHKVIFIGEGQQIITLNANGSKFNIVEFQNHSEEGIYSQSSFVYNEMIRNGCRLSIGDMGGEYGFDLNEDMTIEGDFVLVADTLNLNGHVLTVKGDLIQAGGIIHVNGGKLIVEGDYRIQTRNGAEGSYTYDQSTGILQMQNENDYVLVNGSFYTASKMTHTGYLTNGVLEVKGDFTRLNTTTSYNFVATENHKVLLSGEGKQTITLNNSGTYCTVANLELANASEEGVVFGTGVYVTGEIRQNESKVSGSVWIGANTVFTGNTYTGDVHVASAKTISEELTINGNVTLGASLNLSGKLVVNGDITTSNSSGQIRMQRGSLYVSGNLTITYYQYGYGMYMTNSEDYIYVGGDFYAKFYYTPTLSAGTLEVAGDFTVDNGAFCASGSHKVLLSGTQKQTVNMANGCYFATLELKNTGEKGVYSTKALSYTTLIRNGCNLQYGDTEGVYGWKLSEDCVIEGDLVLLEDTLNLNGYNLTVTGDFIHMGGAVQISGGSLTVDGDYRQQIRNGEEGAYTYTASGGQIVMTDVSDFVHVKGDFVIQPSKDMGTCLSAGVLNIGGDFTQVGSYGFKASGTHLLLFSGNETQTISAATTMTVANLTIDNTGSEEVKLNAAITVLSEATDTYGNISGSGAVSIANLEKLTNNSWSGNLKVTGSNTLSSDLKVGGTLTTSGNFFVNGYNLYADAINVSSYFHLQNGTVSCNGNFNVNSTGRLVMQDAMGYLLVGENFSIDSKYSHSGLLTEGLLEIRGDFVQSYTNNFIATQNHTTILSRKRSTTGRAYIQTISFSHAGNAKFNILVLKKPLAEYQFRNSTSLICNELIYDIEDSTAPTGIGEIYARSKDVTQITIAYTAAEDESGVAGYEIYRNNVKIAVTSNLYFRDYGLQPDTEYTYTVYAYDNYRNIAVTSPELTVKTLEDTEAPAVVSRPVVATRTGSSITLSWEIPVDNVKTAGYNIYRNDKLIAENIANTVYKDTGLEKNAIYRYAVVAYDASGNISEKSENVEATVAAPVITDVSPSDYSNIGGNRVTLSVKFKNVGNSIGNKVKIEYREEGEDWKPITPTFLGQMTYNSTTLYVNYAWDISKLAGDKEYVIRYTLYDADNNTDVREVNYIIDKEAPKTVTDLEAKADNGTILLSWEVSTSADCVKYNIYRKNDTDDTFALIDTVNGKNESYYTDKTVEEGQAYIYAVTAIDNYANESKLSETATALVDIDKTPPVVKTISPLAGKVNALTVITATATDNLDVSRIKFLCKKDGEEQWTELATVDATKGKASYSWDTTGYEDGVYYINAVAIDGSGNESLEEYTRRYIIDNTGISKINITKGETGVTSIRLHWEDVADTDFSYFQVEQKVGDTYQKVGVSYNTLGYTINNLVPETTYSFIVVGYDSLGNRGEESEEFSITTSADQIQPQIKAIYPVSSYYKDLLKLQARVTDNYAVGSVVFSYSLDGINFEEIAEVEATSNASTCTLSKDFDISAFEEGSIFIRFEAYDKAGNKNILSDSGEDIVVEYFIDKTAPAKVQNLKAVDGDGYVELTWDTPADKDIAYYRIYRASNEDGIFKLIKDRCTTLNYYDTGVEVGSSYIYKLEVVDIAGNIGEMSDEIVATASADDTAPFITSMSPYNEEKVGGNPVIKALAMDNSKLATVRMEYISADSVDGIWSLIGSTEAKDRSHLASFTWNTEGLQEGTYRVRSIATDIYGNVSQPFEVSYVLDLTAPQKPALSVTNGHFEIGISVEHAKEDDFWFYEIQRKMVEDNVWKTITQTTEQSYTDKEVQVDTVYLYRVLAYDKYGNYSVTLTEEGYADDVDVVAPVISVAENMVGLVGMELAFDGMGSTDNVRITEYKWDMGNGDIIYGSQPCYTYDKAGVYLVKLTVRDAAGNVASDTINVRIDDRTGKGIAKVRIVSDSGQPIPYAYVYMKLDEGNHLSLRADSNGYVTVVEDVGLYSIAAYSDGFLPDDMEIVLNEYETKEYTLKLVEDELIVGELTVHRMTLEEMVEMGVDFSDPANYHSYVFNVTLTFQEEPLPITIQYICNSNGVAFGGPGIGGGSGGSVTTSSNRRVSVQGAKVETEPGEETVPILAYVSTVQSVSWLKEMYEVELGIFNAADAKYVIEDSYATLNLPEKGVSLAATNKGQTLTQSMGSIAGQERKSVSWVVRGDESGSYSLSADFEGRLMPFDARVTAHFETENEFEVTTGEGLHIYVMPEYSAYIGENYYIQFKVKNESDHPFYNVKTSFGPQITPAKKYIVTDVNTGETYTSDAGTVDIVSPANLNQSVVVNENSAIRIATLNPGEEVCGTFVTTFSANTESNPDEVYYQLIDWVVDTLEGENLGVKVSVLPIASHISKSRVKVVEIPTMYGDPIDVTSGYFVEELTPLSVTGATPLTFDLNYSSGITDTAGEMGYGWHHDYEVFLKENQGIITFYTNPSVGIPFIKEGYYASTTGDKLVLAEGVQYSYGEYTCLSSLYKDYGLTKNTDGTYTITMPNGGRYEFDTQGRLTAIVTSEGKSVALSHQDKVTVVTETASKKRLYLNYNDERRIVSVADDAGRQIGFTYSAEGNLSTLTDPEGNVLTYTYDGSHRILTEGNEQGVYVTNGYDEEGRVIKQTDALGNVMTATYETTEEGLIVSFTDAAGNVNKAYVDSNNRLTKVVDGEGRFTEYQYDAKGNLVCEKDAYGKAIYREYDTAGNMIKLTDKGGISTTITYDERGNVASTTNAKGKVATYTYNTNNLLTSSTDYNGLTTTYEYNANGQIIKQTTEGIGSVLYTYENGLVSSVTDYLGNVTTSQYDEAGNLIKQTDAMGNTTGYEYDNLSRITKKTDSAGNSYTYRYDCNGNLIAETDALGNQYTYQYDRAGNRILQTNPDGTDIKYTYDSSGNCTKVTFADQTSNTYTYDGSGNLIKEVLADGTMVTYTYDLLNQRISETDKDGRKISYEYYPNGNLYKTIYQDGTYELYTYDQSWNVISITNQSGHTVSYEYDSMGNVTMQRDALGNAYRYEYDALGRVIKETDANGNSTTYAYDANSNCIKKTNAAGVSVHMTYDALNRMTSAYTTDSAGEEYRISYTYDSLGRVVTTTDEEGYTTRMTYDGAGNLKSLTDAKGTVTAVRSYDSMGRITSVTDAAGVTTQYSYDVMGNLIETVELLNSQNAKTSYSYDTLGRITSVTDALLGVTSVTYDGRGNVSTLTDANGGTTRYTYDDMDRLTLEVSPMGSPIAYTYNAEGLLASVKNARGQKTTYTYDAAGRVITMTDELGTVSYTYDANGNILTVSDENGTITRKYDALNRITEYTDYKGNTIKYAYDQIGNLVSLTYPGGEIVKYSYYKNGWLRSVTDTQGLVTTYEYDCNGNMTRCTRPNATAEICTYDASGRLLMQKDVKVAADGAEEVLTEFTYTYDERGNITAISGNQTTDTKEGLSALKSAEMTYDADNRLLTYNGESIRYDADGNMTYGPVNGVMSELTYDCRNRLVCAGGVSYTYDAENNRIAVETSEYIEEYVVDTVSSALSRILITKVYEKDTVEEASSITTYIYGNGLISEYQGDIAFYHHYNNLGSTMKLTDREGKEVASYTYGAYGELLSGDTSLTAFLYNGRCGVVTDDNGLYHMRQRYYNTEIKRFVNQDVIRGSLDNSQSLNRYSYVQGNPISYTDPFGLSPVNGLFTGTSFTHAVLGLIGIIPGPIGIVANLVDAAIYAFVDHDYAMMTLSLVSASTMGMASIAKITKVGSTTAKTARYLSVMGSVISNGASFAMNAGIATDTMVGMYDKYIVQGLPFDESTSGELLTLGISTLGCILSGKGVSDDTHTLAKLFQEDNVAARLTNSLTKGMENIKGEFRAAMADNRGCVDLSAFRRGSGTPKSGSSSSYSVSDSRRNHILEGEGPTDPGHGPNRGFTEGAFPDTWTDEQVISAIEDVANNPNSTWKQSTGPGAGNAPITAGAPDVNAPSMTNKGTPVRFIVKGRNHGLNITVIVEPHGEGIITGYNSGR